MLGCADTSFGVPYTCRICVVLVSSLLYHVIIFQKLPVSLDHTIPMSMPVHPRLVVEVLFAVNIFEHWFTSTSL